MMNKKQVFAALALIAIATTTIAYAQMVIGAGTVAITESKVNSVTLPSIAVEPQTKRTATQANGLYITVYFQHTVIRVALTDIMGLYESMKEFTVTFKDASYTYAVLTLEEPVAEFVYTSTSPGFGYTDIIISYVSEKKIASSIQYRVSAEVVGVYGSKL